ncbi:DUF6011 domain-containing protein [Bradyrhizobium barranii]|uniref:DUF6011 domain-containing protein n=1 Tax=Bradyrhizobium barranii TaxID=2992140 RepID=A0ABY3QYZ3_9BRAD|nr:DUF6011 domain-containing protein [Bradyrhizobium japonicum]UFW91072.1 DUF6011 domain-containing protein [Bradyrhizobium japonicum]
MTDAIQQLLNGERREISPPAAGNCRRCGGTGKYRRFGRCFACNGTGSATARPGTITPRQRRPSNPAEIAEMALAFRAANPDVMAWIEANQNFDFAVKMGEQVATFGDMSEGQLVACLKCLRAATNAEAAPEISIARIEEAFAATRANDLRRPRLNLATFTFKPAGSNSRWAGSIYVTEGREYLGRITHGRFVCSSACTHDKQAKIVEAAADPHAAAVAYGRRTGSCACCGRALTDPSSIERGIGPVCAENYGW